MSPMENTLFAFAELSLTVHPRADKTTAIREALKLALAESRVVRLCFPNAPDQVIYPEAVVHSLVIGGIDPPK